MEKYQDIPYDVNLIDLKHGVVIIGPDNSGLAPAGSRSKWIEIVAIVMTAHDLNMVDLYVKRRIVDTGKTQAFFIKTYFSKHYRKKP